jgi:transposase
VGNKIIREYTYAYLTTCPETGETYSLILPYANESCMDVFMKTVSEAFNHYRIIKVMDGASWHTGKKTGRQENIIPLFQPPYSLELNPVECLWHLISEDGGFKNSTVNTLPDVELKLEEYLKNMDKETVKSITLFNWIKKDIW